MDGTWMVGPGKVLVGSDMQAIELLLYKAIDLASKFTALDGLEFLKGVLSVQEVE